MSRFEIERGVFYRGLDIAAVAMCSDDLRLHLAGVHLRAADQGLVLHATDGHRLMRVEALLRSPISSPVEAFIDRASVKHLIKVLRPSKAERDEIVTCELASSGPNTLFRVSGMFGEENIPVIEGESLPPYPKVVPAKREPNSKGAGLIGLSAVYLGDVSTIARHVGDGLKISIREATDPVRIDASGDGLSAVYVIMPRRF